MISDCNASAKTRGTSILRWDKDTLNTPYKSGLSSTAEGVVIDAGMTDYRTQISIGFSAEALFMRRYATGAGWNDWCKITPDKEWKLLAVKSLTTSNTAVGIPSTASEILVFAGAPNDNDVNQIYGGKSYVVPTSESHNNIVYEKELYNASGTSKANGFYAFYNNKILSAKIDSGSARMRVYYR